MKKVVCFGEALIDFLNTGRRREGELSLNDFTQFPGGAPANAAVAVAKLGGKAAFAGQVGDDPFGHFLVAALRQYGVDTSFVRLHPSANTALAFVFLDEHGDRSFFFHRHKTADVLLSAADLGVAWVSSESILHICSNTLTAAPVAETTRFAVSQARAANMLVSFDVNLRHNLWPAGAADAVSVNALVRQADLVKFSSDEINYLSGGKRQSYLAECFAAGLSAALVTDGAGDVCIYTAQGDANIVPPSVAAVDTTGGGDAFIGAMLFALSRRRQPLEALADAQEMRRLATFAAHCGALAVCRRGAFTSLPRFAEVESFWES